MKSKVFFANLDRVRFRGIVMLIDDLFDQAGFNDLITPDDTVAIKIHTGDEYSPHTVRPGFIRRVVENVKASEGIPLVSDACQLYKIAKATSYGFIESAKTNGFDATTLGAPVIPADGYNITFKHPMRCEDVLLEISDGGLLKHCEIASLFVESDSMIVCARISPFPDVRSVLKHIGMGCASKRGKARIHGNSTQPIVDIERCTGCGACLHYCGWDAIKIEDSKAKINYKLCVGCGFCEPACDLDGDGGLKDPKYIRRNGAIMRQIGVVDAAASLLQLKIGKVGYFAFLMDYVDECENWTKRPPFPDIGILASTDPVALDVAAYDLIAEAPFLPWSSQGKGPEYNGTINQYMAEAGYDWQRQISHAEKLGLGIRNYELIEIDASGSKYEYHGKGGYAESRHIIPSQSKT